MRTVDGGFRMRRQRFPCAYWGMCAAGLPSIFVLLRAAKHAALRGRGGGTAVDASVNRAGRLQENLGRVGLSASVLIADALSLSPGQQFDCVLLDAPCSATGTIRRHPELPYIRKEAEIGNLVDLQQRLLMVAAGHVKPGGRLIYCTCSLEREEGEAQVRRLLQDHPAFIVVPVEPNEGGLIRR